MARCRDELRPYVEAKWTNRDPTRDRGGVGDEPVGSTVEDNIEHGGLFAGSPQQVIDKVGLLKLGARPADIGQTGQEQRHVLAEPEGNEFCLLKAHLGALWRSPVSDDHSRRGEVVVREAPPRVGARPGEHLPPDQPWEPVSVTPWIR